jgi:hypothetical protein
MPWPVYIATTAMHTSSRYLAPCAISLSAGLGPSRLAREVEDFKSGNPVRGLILGNMLVICMDPGLGQGAFHFVYRPL